MTPDGRTAGPVGAGAPAATESDADLSADALVVSFSPADKATPGDSRSSRPPPLPAPQTPSKASKPVPPFAPPPPLPSSLKNGESAKTSLPLPSRKEPQVGRRTPPERLAPKVIASAAALTLPPPVNTASELPPEDITETLEPELVPDVTPEEQAAAFISRCEALLAEHPNTQRTARLHYEIARLWEYPLNDPKKAVHHYQFALERAPDHIPTIRGLRRGLIAKRSLRQAADLYDAEARLTPEPHHKARLLFAKGRLLEDSLAMRQEAQKVYASALDLVPSDTLALKALQQCELAAESWPELASTLSREANAVSSDPPQRAALLVQRAQIFETRLKDVEAAIAQYETALEINPNAYDALEALKRLYYARGRHRDLMRVLEIEAARSGDVAVRITALHGVARLHADKLGNRPDAIHALERALAAAPRNRLLLEELAQLKEASRDFTGLAQVLSQLADALGTVPDRAGLLHRIGQIHDEHLGNAEAAQQWFAQSLAIDPCYVPSLQALAVFYASREQWDALMAMHLDEAHATSDATRRAAAHARVAEILEKKLDDVNAAIEHHARALSAVPIYALSFKALTRLFSQTRRFRELIELYERAVERVETERALTYLLKVGSLYEDQLDDPTQAMHAYRRVLKRDPKHLGALHALQRAAEAAERYADLSQALVQEAELTVDREQRVALLHRAAEVLDEHLNERDAAVAMLRRVVALDSRYVPALTTLGRIFYHAGRWDDLLSLYQAELAVLGETPRAAQLLFKMAEIAENRLGRHPEATELYRRAVTLDPSSSTALRALGRKLREQSRWEELIEVLQRDVRNHAEPEERAAIYFRVGEVFEYRLNRVESALEAYDKALNEDETQLLGLEARVRLRASRGEHGKLCEDLGRALELAHDPARRIALLMQLGETLRDHQRDVRRAVACFEEVRALDRSHHGALLALESLYRKTHQWPELSEVLTTSAHVLNHVDSKTAALRELARVGARTESPATRLTAYQEILALSPQDMEALCALELIALESRDTELLRFVDESVSRTSRDRALRASHLTRLGELLEKDAPERSLVLFRNALECDSDNLAAARGLSRLAVYSNVYEILVEAARREADVLSDRKTAAVLYVRAARATQADELAVEALERALELDPENSVASAALREALQRTNEFERLSELLARAANSCTNPARAASIWREVASLYASAQGNLAGAVSALERALRLVPDEPEAMSELAHVFKRDGQFNQSAQLFVRITELNQAPNVVLQAHIELATLLEESLKAPARAIQHLRAALEMRTDDRGLLHRLSLLLSSQDQHDEALIFARKLLDLSPSPAAHVSTLLHIAKIEQRRRDLPGFLSAITDAVVLDGPHGGAGAAMREAIGSAITMVDYERALRGHVKSVGESRPAPGQVYLELARVQAELDAKPKALATLREGVRKHPGDLAVRTQYAQMLLETGHASESVDELRNLLLLEPERAATWNDLARAFETMELLDPAARVKEVLRLMGHGPRGVDGPKPAPLPQTPGLWDEQAIEAVGADLLRMGIAGELLGYLAEGLDKLYPPDLAGYGTSARDRLTARSGHPLRALADQIGALVGVSEFELFLHRARRRGPGIELDSVPLLVVPSWILEQSESQQAFMLTRMLVLCARKCHPLLKLAPRELEVTFAAYARNWVPAFGAGLTSEDILDDHGRRLAKALSRRTRKLAEESVLRYAAHGGMDLVQWVESREREATRVAALVSDDLSGALECLSRSRDTGATDRSEETARDLYRFWVGEAAIQARRRMF